MEHFTTEKCREFFNEQCYEECPKQWCNRIEWLCRKCHIDQSGQKRNPEESPREIDEDEEGFEDAMRELYGENED
jgi:hypothetical protein